MAMDSSYPSKSGSGHMYLYFFILLKLFSMYWFRCFKCTEYQLKVLSDQHWTVYSSEHELNFVIHPFSGCLSEILQFCIKIEKKTKNLI